MIILSVGLTSFTTINNNCVNVLAVLNLKPIIIATAVKVKRIGNSSTSIDGVVEDTHSFSK